MEGKLKEEEYDTENVTVQIVELSPDEIAKSNNWIGSNKPVYEGKAKNDSKKSNENRNDGGTNGEDEEEEEEEEAEKEEEVPGFTVTSTKKGKKRTVSTQGDAGADNDADAEDTKPKRKRKNLPESFSSKREIGQVLAKNVQNKLRQSKVFRTKAKLERVHNMKKARIIKDKKTKLKNKRDKHKKNSTKGGAVSSGKEKPPKFNKKGRVRK